MSTPHLTHPMTLERALPVDDGAGGAERLWHELGTLWAGLEPRSGRFAAAVAGPVSLQGWRITTRAAPPGAPARPRPGDRLREASGTAPRLFRVLAVAETGPQARFLTVTAEEELAP